MLILSRSIGQSICIGDDVIIRILGGHGKKLSIGIEAPDNVKVLRAEINPNYVPHHTNDKPRR